MSFWIPVINTYNHRLPKTIYYDLLISYMFFKVFLFVFLTLRLLFLATYCALSLPIVQFLPYSILLNLIWRVVNNQINKLVWCYKEISKWEFVDPLLSEGHEFYCLDFVSPILAFHASFFFFFLLPGSG